MPAAFRYKAWQTKTGSWIFLTIKGKMYSMKIIINRMTLMLATLFLAVVGASAAPYTDLYDFTALSSTDTNLDGSGPMADLVLSSNMLYGTAADGGTNGLGTIFAISTDGHVFTNLHNFDQATNGAGPLASLVVSGNMLYGTTRAGGSNGLGTVFAISTNGKGFVILHQFGGSTDRGSCDRSQLQQWWGLSRNRFGVVQQHALRRDGARRQRRQWNPLQDQHRRIGLQLCCTISPMWTAVIPRFTWFCPAPICLAPHALAAALPTPTPTAATGPCSGSNTNGLDFTNLYSFGDFAADPFAGLVLSGNTLYGTTVLGSGGPDTAPYGTVFKINTDGTGFTTIYSLDPELGGGDPSAGLVISMATPFMRRNWDLTTAERSSQVNTDGTGYTNLTSFNSPGDPRELDRVVVIRRHAVWHGVERRGQRERRGVRLDLAAPSLNIQLIQNAVVLNWNDPSSSLYTAPTHQRNFHKHSRRHQPLHQLHHRPATILPT
jgi:uncharacterized repeat protein (TIGR03803 family)